MIFRIPLDLNPDVGHKNRELFKILPEKSLEFVSSRADGTVTFNFSLMLLLVEVDLILEEQGGKKDTLGFIALVVSK